jgi:hypothetical protein
MAPKFLLMAFAVVLPSAAQLRTPDLQAQRTAMRKLGFLTGKWSGEARLLRAPGEWAEVVQTEEAQFKLDGLILVIEGVGRAKADDKPILQAFGVLSYDDETATYHMRAFNDGRFLESEVKLLDDGKGMTWGFSLGQIKTLSTLRMTQNGEWTELAEIKFGSQPPQKLMDLTVRRQK